jgi:hypothetical protein
MNILLCLGATAGLAAVMAPTQGEMIRAELHAKLKSIAVEYVADTTVGQGMLFRGEPLEVDLMLWSVGSAMSGAESDWYTHVKIVLRPGRLSQRDSVPGTNLRCLPEIRPDRLTQPNLVDRIQLTRGERVTVRCRLATFGPEMVAGPYSLTFGWADSVDTERFVDTTTEPLRDAFEFEFREVGNEMDRIERDYRLAVRALLYDKDPVRALPFLDAILLRYPNSRPALLARARANRDSGRCDLAVRDISEVVTPVRSDVGDPRNGRATEPLRDRLAVAAGALLSGGACSPSKVR